jgi:ankyrin repeat protein
MGHLDGRVHDRTGSFVLPIPISGFTPLYMVTRNGYRNVAEMLLAKGAEVNVKSNFGWTPLHFAADHKDVAELLLAHKADVNAKDIFGETPLHGEAMSGCKAVVKLLLANKADVNARDKHGDTPLHVASASKLCGKDVVELLRQHGGHE